MQGNGIALVKVNVGRELAADTQALLKLGRALIDHGDAGKAFALIEQAMRDQPDDRILREVAALAFTHGVPRYHAGMLADQPRNDAYASAITRAAPGRRLFDIGSGSGLLAMIGARSGASAVLACEANASLAAMAEQIIAANGLSEQVRLIPSHSTKITTDDLGGPVDLIVTETFGHDLLGEHALPSLCDALQRLASPGCQVIPASGSIRVALASLDKTLPPPPGRVHGFDLSLVGRHIPSFQKVEIGDPALHLRSEPLDLFSFEFSNPATMAASSAAVRAIAVGGRIDGVALWLRLELDDEVSYENRPGPGAQSHWRALFWPFPAAIDTDPGQPIDIRGWHDQREMRVWVGD